MCAIAMLGCGGGATGAGVDGSSVDAFVDATCVSDGTSGSVVATGDFRIPTTILVHDRTGAVVGRTEASGQAATIAVSSCDMVTFYTRETDSVRIVTIAGVQPDDALALEPVAMRTTPVALDVTMPGIADASDYTIETLCTRFSGSGSAVQHATPGVTRIADDCESGRAMTVLAIAATAAGPRYAAAVSPIVGSGPIPIQLPDFDPIHTLVTTLGSADLEDAFLSLSAAPTSTSEYPLLLERPTMTGDGMFAFPPAPIPSTPVVAETTITRHPADASLLSSTIRRTLPPASTTLAITGDDLLATPSAARDGDTTRPTIRWDVDAAAPVSYATIALLVDGGSWTVVVPPVRGAFHVPELPSDLSTGDVKPSTFEIVDAPGTPYAAARGLVGVATQPLEIDHRATIVSIAAP